MSQAVGMCFPPQPYSVTLLGSCFLFCLEGTVTVRCSHSQLPGSQALVWPLCPHAPPPYLPEPHATVDPTESASNTKPREPCGPQVSSSVKWGQYLLVSLSQGMVRI